MLEINKVFSFLENMAICEDVKIKEVLDFIVLEQLADEGHDTLENKVSLWLGHFEEEERFREYFKVSYDEDGNYIPSEFQKSFEIKKYDLYAAETDWLSKNCIDVMSLLQGFSGDAEIIPQFEKMIDASKVGKYNSIVLLYNFQYEAGIISDSRMQFIGCVDVHI